MKNKGLKALAHAVMERNRQGNLKETLSFPDGKPGAVENPESFPEKTAGKAEETVVNDRFLRELSAMMDKAREDGDFETFQYAIEKTLRIPGLLKSEAGVPQAAKIRSKVLGADVWVITHPEAISLVPEGEVYFTPEEIRNLKGSTPEEIRAVYMAKRYVGGRLIAVKERGEGNA
jgi:hypothetical protein